MFPPHARGWTFKRTHELILNAVSPARAGMDRCVQLNHAVILRFPRTRGDGPFMEQRNGDTGVFPPHARGWTLFPISKTKPRTVSPARAGMDPHQGKQSDVGTCFPRTRGDGPRVNRY